MIKTHPQLTRGGFDRRVLSSRPFWAIVATIGILGMGVLPLFGQAPAPSSSGPSQAVDPDATLDELAKPRHTYAAMSYAKKIREEMAVADEAGVAYSGELIDLIENFFRHGHRDPKELAERRIAFLDDRTRIDTLHEVVTRRYARDWVLILFDKTFPPEDDLILEGESAELDAGSDAPSITNRDNLRRVFIRLARDAKVADLETARRWKLFYSLADRILTSEIDGVDDALENLDQVSKTLRRVARSWQSEDLSQIEHSLQSLRNRVLQFEE